MTEIAIAAEPGRAEQLSRALTAAGHRLLARAGSAEQLLGILRDDDVAAPTAVIVSAARRFLTAELIGACDRGGIRLLAVAAGAASRRHAAHLGLFEVVDADAEWDEIERMLVSPVLPPLTRGDAGGTVIALWGPAGAPGRTALATTLAAELAWQGRSVALCDVDTYGGSISTALGLLDEAPGFAAACRLAGSGGLTLAELDRVAVPLACRRGSIRVLTGIARPTRWPELSEERVTEVIERCRSWADVTVLDTGFSLESDEEISSDLAAPRRNAATLAALDGADRIVEVGTADPVGMSRLLRAHAELGGLLPSAAVTVVVNRVRPSAVGLSPAHQVTSTLARFGGINAPALIPEDQRGFDAALLSARTLTEVAPRSQARVAIRRLAEALVAPAVTEQFSASRRRRRPVTRRPWTASREVDATID